MRREDVFVNGGDTVPIAIFISCVFYEVRKLQDVYEQKMDQLQRTGTARLPLPPQSTPIPPHRRARIPPMAVGSAKGP